jgi:hypothetical protein
MLQLRITVEAGKAVAWGLRTVQSTVGVAQCGQLQVYSLVTKHWIVG